MRYAEIRQREDISSILPATLARGLSTLYGARREVSCDPSQPGQRWFLSHILSGFHVQRPVASARRFLADGIRYTPRRWRLPVQWPVGTLLASRWALAWGGRFGFTVSPAIPDPRFLLIIPGNQRLRLLDFKRGTTRAFLKHGFSTRSMLAEIRVRGTGRCGPFVPLTAHDPDGAWIEERLIPGFSLPRCPPWRDRRGYTSQAFVRLEQWLGDTSQPRSTVEHVEALADSVAVGLGSLTRCFSPSFPAGKALKTLVDRSLLPGDIEVAESHGDFQAGNVLVEYGNGRVSLIDWEYSDLRERHYDLLVFGLRSRFPSGLAQRASAFIETGRLPEVPRTAGLPRTAAGRSAAIRLFLLEELAWHIEHALRGQYNDCGSGVRMFQRELSRFLKL